jgi:acetyl esterase
MTLPHESDNSLSSEAKNDPDWLNDRYARLSHADSEYLRQLRSEPSIGTLTPEAERERMRRGQTAALANFPVSIRTFQTTQCPVHVIRPIDEADPLPITFHFHGGGWTLGDLQTHAHLVCELAIRSRSAVAFIEYPLAPEYPFPAPLEACVVAVSEVLDRAATLGLDGDRRGFVGDSSGGNLCLTYSVLSRERNLPLPQTQVLLYPAGDASCSLPSHRRFASSPNLSSDSMEWFWSNYVRDRSLRETALASPLHASEETVASFPPTLIISCEYDILRDEAEQIAARLVRAGAEVIAVRWLGVLHGFMVNESLSASATAQAAVNFVAQHLVAAYGATLRSRH